LPDRKALRQQGRNQAGRAQDVRNAHRGKKFFFKVVELQSEHICISCDAVPISWELACQRGVNIPGRSLRDYTAADESKHGWTVRAAHT